MERNKDEIIAAILGRLNADFDALMDENGEIPDEHDRAADAADTANDEGWV